MSKDSNIAVVQSCYANFAKGNIGGLLDALSDNIVWDDPGYPDVPYAGRYVGKAATAEFFSRLAGAVCLPIFSPNVYISHDNLVVVLGFMSGHGKASGKSFSTNFAMVFTVENGKVSHFEAHSDTAAIARAFRS